MVQGYNPKVIWFTGLSGSGKTTLASALRLRLIELGFNSTLLDGDIIRKGLNKDLGFNDADRRENIRRIGEVSKILIDSGLIVLSAFISPYERDRAMVREIVGSENVIEVFVDCPLEVCEARDTKGLYKRARAGELPDFTGIGSPYERPSKPEIIIRTDQLSVDQSLERLIAVAIKQIDPRKS
jgi:adenylyl-sulfate kinase